MNIDQIRSLLDDVETISTRGEFFTVDKWGAIVFDGFSLSATHDEARNLAQQLNEAVAPIFARHAASVRDAIIDLLEAPDEDSN